MADVRLGIFHRPAPEAPPESAEPPAPPAAAGRGPSAPLPHDQLGLVSSDAITVRARVERGAPTLLRAPVGGLYRPPDFRPAPWSGLAYDLAPDDGTGLAAGGRVLTARGEVPVERLTPADEVLGLRGPRLVRPACIARRVAPGRGAGTPVRIAAGALGGGLPRRPLVLAPDHLLFLPEPVPARALVDGAAVRWDEATLAEWFHLALEAYPGAEDGDVLLVDGVSAGTCAALAVPP